MLQSGRSVSGPGLGGLRLVGRLVRQCLHWRIGDGEQAYVWDRSAVIIWSQSASFTVTHRALTAQLRTLGGKKQNARLSGCFSLTVNLTGVSLSLMLQTHSVFYAKPLDITLLTGLGVNRSGASFCLLHKTVWPCRCFSTSNFECTCRPAVIKRLGQTVSLAEKESCAE